MYGTTGVCQVEQITNRDYNNIEQEQLYYVLRPLYQNYRILTSVENKKVCMRPLVSREEAEQLIDSIPQLQAHAYYNRALKDLESHYSAVLKQHTCMDLVQLAMSIYAKKQEVQQQGRKFGVVDARFMKRAEELLFGELAAVLDIPREAVPDYIASRIKALPKGDKMQESPG